jgi:HK97 family phage prohead protease
MSTTRDTPPKENLIRAVMPGVEFRDATGGDPLPEGVIGVLRVLFSPVGEWTEINSAWEGNFLERFAPGAWKKTIRESVSKIRSLFQHGHDPQVGDKPLGPIIRLEENSDGGYGEVHLLDTSYNRDLLPGLKAGLYGASHRFGALREQWEENPTPSEANPKGLPERTIKEARLMEFGPVTWGAYDGATAGVRSLTDEFLMSAIRSNPDKAREMLDRASRQVISGDVSPLNRALEDVTDELELQNQAASAIAGISGREALEALTDIISGQIAGQQAEVRSTQQDAPSEDDAEPAEAHLADERREDKPTAPKPRPLYGTSRKETPSWLLGQSKSTKRS